LVAREGFGSGRIDAIRIVERTAADAHERDN